MYTWHLATGRAFVTSGVGYGRTELSAFDAAELDAGIMATNAVRASSFIPPGWAISRDKEALRALSGNGAFLPMAYAHGVSRDRRVAASLAIGVNRDRRSASIIMEHAGLDVSKEESLAEAEICLADALGARKWEVERLERAAVEASPRDRLYVCALVAVVFVVDGPAGR
jgi:pyruvoyl-dependent arginine decarboxylase